MVGSGWAEEPAWGGHLSEDDSGQRHQTAISGAPISPLLAPRSSCCVPDSGPPHASLGGHQTPLPLRHVLLHILYMLLSWGLFSPDPLPRPDESTAPCRLWPLPHSPRLQPLRPCYLQVRMGSPSLSGQGPLDAPKPPTLPHQAFAISCAIRPCSEVLTCHSLPTSVPAPGRFPQRFVFHLLPRSGWHDTLSSWHGLL